MRRKPLAWYVVPGVTVASLTALGAIGGAIVVAAKFITLPARAEAMEQKNVEQDKWLDKLSVIAEQNQKLIDAATTPNAPHPTTQHYRERDELATWCCEAKTYEDCWRNRLWKRCEDE